MKKFIIVWMKKFIIASCICFILSGCTEKVVPVEPESNAVLPVLNLTPSIEESKQQEPKQQEQVEEVFQKSEENIGDNLPVSRALAAKMLVMAYNDISTIATLDKQIEFSDVAVEAWYYKYINAAYANGFMSGTGDLFMPEQPITLGQARMLFDKIAPKNKLKFKIDEDTKDTPISYALWTQLYTKFLEDVAGDKSLKEYFGISENAFIILATSSNNSQLRAWDMITDKGPMTYMGLNMGAYIDKKIKVLQKDGDVIAILSVLEQSPTIENAYIVKVDDTAVTIFSGGAERVYKFVNNLQGIEGKLCDIKINSGSVEEIKVWEQEFREKIILTNDSKIVFEERTAMDIGDSFKVYAIVGGIAKWKSIRDLVVGTDLAKFVVKDGRLCGAIITENPDALTLRVAINTSGYEGLYHKKVILKSNKNISIKSADNSLNYQADEEITIDETFFKNSERIQIETEEDGDITIASIERNWPNAEKPKYKGKFEIIKDNKGYVIVNIIDIEKYLYAVVPSEMPSSYGVAASKAQAITARSYAYNQYYANRYHKYGANIDDSVSCQVYNNIPANDVSIAAVDGTRGQMLTYNGNVISANFFSTSSGMTANDGEVWANSTTKHFPTVGSGYLKATKQYSGNDYGDLSIEKNAEKFFKSTDIQAYDSQFSWFRWNVEMSAEEIAASINANLRARYEANPPLIKTLQDGVYKSRLVDNIGELKDLEIISRGEGGNIMKMKITGTKAVVMLHTEYNVRAIIRPSQYLKDSNPIKIFCKDGKTIENYSIMPSAFYVMEKTLKDDGSLEKVTFYGGGNGHGAGMSQNGVKGMADAGFATEEILEHYYRGAKIESLY